MKPRPVRTALVDSGFWFALLDEGDQHSRQADAKAESVLSLKFVVPWPVLHETLCTRLVRRPRAVLRFESLLKRPNAALLPDEKYRDESLEQVFAAARRGQREISLVDMILRLILDDVNVRVDGLVTFNHRDFADVCRRRQIQIL